MLAHTKSSSTASERIRLLVKELDSAPLTSGDAGEFDETLVIVQMPGELPASFAQRAIERMGGIERAGRSIASATLQAGARTDKSSRAARRRIALALAHQGGKNSALRELVVEVPGAADEAVRHELLGLVDELLSTTPDAPTPVRLRFGAPQTGSAPKSGVFWSLPRKPS